MKHERYPLPAHCAAVAMPDLDTLDNIADGVAALMATLPQWATAPSDKQRMLAGVLRGVSDELLKVAHQTWLGEMRAMHQTGEG